MPRRTARSRFFPPHLVLLGLLGLLAVTPAAAQRQIEALDRGMVAVRKSSTQVSVGWRLLGNDPAGLAFNLYRSANGGSPVRLNTSPLTQSTHHTDTPPSLSTTSYTYFVRPVADGTEMPRSETTTLPPNAPVRQYLPVPLRNDTGPDGPYDVKFAWVGDLDGDGGYDLVCDRISTLGSREQFLEAYKRDGTFLWRMAMGPNSVNQYAIEPGATAISVGDTDNVTVHDMDGDGRAEVLVRTGNGVTVTNAAGTRVASVTSADTEQFLSVIDGLTGAELARAPLPNGWATHGVLTNRAMIAYLDGKRPSVVMYGNNRANTGEFYRQFTAWDYRGGTLTRRWTRAWNPNTHPGAEGHQVRIADVDNDGRDEICDLGHVVDDDGSQLFSTPLTHGDRFHISDLDPDRPGLETFAIQQNNPTMLATALYESGTGRMIRTWYSTGLVDVGRGIAIDLDPAHRGRELYSTQPGIFNAKGQRIHAKNIWPPEGLWWDGDLGREFVDGAGSGALSPTVQKFNPATGGNDRLYSIYNEGVHQAYGGRPAFWGDILGDWREEIVLVANDFSELRIYTTTIATSKRLPTLMHNPQYRCQATTKGYVQGSDVDYGLGFDTTVIPPAPITRADLAWAAGTTWDDGLSTSWANPSGAPAAFSPRSSVLFDLSGSYLSPILLKGPLSPASVTCFAPQDFAIDGTAGKLTGTMTLLKSGKGSLTLGGNHDFSGATTVWDGALVIDGRLETSPVTVWCGIWGGAAAMGRTGGRVAGSGRLNATTTIEERGAITPGAGMNAPGTLTFGSHLVLKDRSVIAVDISDDPPGITRPSDAIHVAGNLTLQGSVHLHVNPTRGKLAPGTYRLLTFAGNLTGSAANLVPTLPAGTPFRLTAAAGAITIEVLETRPATEVAWTGQVNQTWDLANTANWTRNANSDIFAPGDSVRFAGTSGRVTLIGNLPVSGVLVDTTDTLEFAGTGVLSGTGGLVKTGPGTLALTTANTYSGPTLLQDGTLIIDQPGDANQPGALGAADGAPSNLILDGGTLAIGSEPSSTNRSLTLGPKGGTFHIPASSSLQISGQCTGTGRLVKTGPGTLILASPNTHGGGTTVREGRLLLASDTANVSGPGPGGITLAGGTLVMTPDDDMSSWATSSWPIDVPAGSAGRLEADPRCVLAGPLTGGGDFTFYTPYVRTDLSGDWSAFAGRILVVTDDDGGEFRFQNTAGWPNALLDLGDGVSGFYNKTMSANQTIAIGTLSGHAGSRLSGGLSSGRTLTYLIGARNEDSTFAGTITNGTGLVALRKTGGAALTLAGTATCGGGTGVAAGTLRVNGTLTTPTLTVESGATVAGAGTLAGNLTLQSGAILEHGAGGSASLTVQGNLKLGANLTIRAANDTTLAAGSLTVLTYTGTLTGTPVITWQAPSGAKWTAVANTSIPGVITLEVKEMPRLPGTVTWTGAQNTNWDTTSDNWLAGTKTAVWMPGDTARFTGPGATTGTIQLPANLEPAGLIVESADDLTFSGSGSLTGPGPLRKAGPGSWFLTGIHALSGETTIEDGTLAITQTGSGTSAVGATLGSTSIRLRGTGQFRMGSISGRNFPSNPISIDAGATATLSSANLANGYGGTISGPTDSSLTLSGPVSLGTSGSAQFANFGGTVFIPAGSQLRFSSTSGANGNGGADTTFVVNGLVNSRNASGTNGVVLGALEGGGSLQGQTNTTAGTVTYRIGSKNLDTTFTGTIANGANGITALVKTGSGSLTLTGNHTHTGSTTISSGTLTVHGSLANSPTTVNAGATLSGGGSLGGPVTCHGTLAPLGTLSCNAGLSIAATSRVTLRPGPAGDRITVTGNLALDGIIDLATYAGLTAGTHTLLTYTGTLTRNTVNLGTVPAGHRASLDTSSPGLVRVILTATGYDSWAAARFTPSHVAAGQSSPDADPDSDDLANLAEYALGQNPLAPTPGPFVTLDPATRSASFQRPAGVTDVTYRLQTSDDLLLWTDLPSTPVDPAATPLTHRAMLPAGTSPRRFVRLLIQR
jgi:fibronectin-binding autotransporter adhesin